MIQVGLKRKEHNLSLWLIQTNKISQNKQLKQNKNKFLITHNKQWISKSFKYYVGPTYQTKCTDTIHKNLNHIPNIQYIPVVKHLVTQLKDDFMIWFKFKTKNTLKYKTSYQRTGFNFSLPTRLNTCGCGTESDW